MQDKTCLRTSVSVLAEALDRTNDMIIVSPGEMNRYEQAIVLF